MLVTDGPPVRGGGGMPQRIKTISSASPALRIRKCCSRTLRCLGRPSVHVHFCKRYLVGKAWLTLIVPRTRGCEFWADDVAFATQAQINLRVPYYASIGVMRRWVLR